MRKKIWVLVLQCLLLVGMGCHLVSTMGAAVQEKADGAIPDTTLSPPEGNTTFLDGTTWCVALPGVSQADLQNALDWACGLGMADCKPIQKGGACYEPDTLLSHASYAFNNYYQQNGNSDIACNFGGTAGVTKKNPSHGKCNYAAPGSVGSTAPPFSKQSHISLWWQLAGLLLPLYLGS
ncbi:PLASMODESMATA CALLOSE-BINDING PROTEIN 5 isoform X2 [Pyrus x bretschneideri]|uniref:PLASMODESMATA CALLOSE-BINDING PROTEIN 5 isoform X2 n=1 Tax=Pyrus x bretschneideri TaxID=225117 RepID=UPI00202EB4C9|nr:PLASMODESMATA CALLOSE-BINDING PROTEIN 5 isoform X2 [Pyrus x bretschneideri]